MAPMPKIAERILLFNGKRWGILFLLGLMGCSTPYPHLPMVIAREALSSAKEVDAGRYSPGLYYQAEEAYRKAMNNYNDKAYDRAIKGFEEARSYAEKAETTARIQRQKAGDEAL